MRYGIWCRTEHQSRYDRSHPQNKAERNRNDVCPCVPRSRPATAFSLLLFLFVVLLWLRLGFCFLWLRLGRLRLRLPVLVFGFFIARLSFAFWLYRWRGACLWM